MWTWKISPGKALECVENLLAHGFADTDCLGVMTTPHGNYDVDTLLEGGASCSMTFAEIKSWCIRELSTQGYVEEFKGVVESKIPVEVLEKFERKPQGPRTLKEHTLDGEDVEKNIGRIIAALEKANDILPDLKLKTAIVRLQEAKFLLEDICERRIIRVQG